MNARSRDRAQPGVEHAEAEHEQLLADREHMRAALQAIYLHGTGDRFPCHAICDALAVVDIFDVDPTGQIGPAGRLSPLTLHNQVIERSSKLT